MNSVSDFFLAGHTASRMVQHRAMHTSGIFRAASKGIVIVMAVASGGGGGAASRRATGGGAGECVVDVISVMPGDLFVVEIGAAGLGYEAIVQTSGGDGGNTVISGPAGYVLTASGGKGGSSSESDVALFGGVGGTGGSGGSERAVRFDGGPGGNVLSGVTGVAATGGGGVSLWGYTTSGGDISTSNTASAGAGCGSDVGPNSIYPSGPLGPVNTVSSSAVTPTDSFALGLRLSYTSQADGAAGWGGRASVGTTVIPAGPFGGSGGVIGTGYMNGDFFVGPTFGIGGGGGGAVFGGYVGAGVRSSPGGRGFALFAEYMEIR